MQVTDTSGQIFQPIHAESAHRALREGQFVPYFQPIVHIRTGQLEGFEILARWQHPEFGLIQPDNFIPSAEKYGWIDALTKELLKGAFTMASLIPAALTLSINISPVQLRSSGLSLILREAAAAAGFELTRLVVEITESALIENIDGARELSLELKRMGCKISLDDFGTGYSSLLHLQTLPFDELKVDRSFVKSMIHRRESRKIVAAVVGLGQSLGLRTLAEGIENQEQAESMLWLGCELGQGYFYGHPFPAHEIGKALAATRHKLVVGSSSPWKKISAANLNTSPSQRIAHLQAIYDGAPVGLAFIDQNLRYVNLNKKLADMNGATVEDHLGSRVSDMIPDLFPLVEANIRRALRGERVNDFEAHLPHSRGTRLVSYQPARDEAGEVVGVSVAIVDISQSKRTEEALQKSEQHYRRMVDLNPEVLWIMDAQGRNLDLSPSWETIEGEQKAKTTAHEWLKAIHPDDRSATLASINSSRASCSPIDVEYRSADEEGSFNWKRARGLPRFNAAGELFCWYGSIQDTDQTRNHPTGSDGKTTQLQAVPLSFPSSTAPIETSVVSSSDHDFRSDLPILNPLAESSGRHVANNSDHKRVRALARLAILDTPPETEFDDLVELACESCATPMGVITLLDSERQWFKASLGIAARETPLADSFCAHAIQQTGLFIVDDAARDDRFRRSSLVMSGPKIRFYAGMPLYAEGGVAIGTLCVMDTVPRSLSHGQVKALSILGKQVQARIELRSERIHLLQGFALNQELAAKLEVKSNALSQANMRLEHLATTDALTGLLNRREFQHRMESLFSRALRERRPLSVMVMDLDDFKRQNDQLSHAAVDEDLRHVGQVLREACRATDSAARIGDEEFALILPETTANQAAILAKRVQAVLRRGWGHFPTITMSIGISSAEISWTTWETLFRNANDAMYEAKRAGRNKLVIAGPLHMPRLKHKAPFFVGSEPLQRTRCS